MEKTDHFFHIITRVTPSITPSRSSAIPVNTQTEIQSLPSTSWYDYDENAPR